VGLTLGALEGCEVGVFIGSARMGKSVEAIEGVSGPFEGVIRYDGDRLLALVGVGDATVDGWINMLGSAEADADGGTEGSMSDVWVGEEMSCTLGSDVGSYDGPPFGRADGSFDGCDVGSPLGCNVGCEMGCSEGLTVGLLVGSDAGGQLGTVVGSEDG
jgi:hypothetical protein